MGITIHTVEEIYNLNLDEVKIDEFWNTSEEKELKMHRIHSYPAKFPAFITNKALEFANKNGMQPKLVADIFCGCGTVAFEAKRNNINFWGCDINPVATMIARAKSNQYKVERLEVYFSKILKKFDELKEFKPIYDNANERIKYWYFEEEYNELYKLKKAIEEVLSKKSSYYAFFICAFSNILKSTSRWLTKSIKPQIDPNKKPQNVIKMFLKQVRTMITASSEYNLINKSSTKIKNVSFLSSSIKKPKVDMIITSPPYVTSYEYADLHQLSSLWLEYTSDYRELREGSVGSLYHVTDTVKNIKELNHIGSTIVNNLEENAKKHAKSVAKYFIDMQKVVRECVGMLEENGMAVFVIGDTEYKNIRIENSKHLIESLLQNGIREVTITKRKIINKFLTPYRNGVGKFSNDKNDRKIYSEEFIVIGRK